MRMRRAVALTLVIGISAGSVGVGAFWGSEPVAASATGPVGNGQPVPTPPSTPMPPAPSQQKPVLTPWATFGTDAEGIQAGAGGTLVSSGGGSGAGSGGGSNGAPARPIDCLVIELDPATEGLGSVTPGLRNADVEEAPGLVEGHRYYQECWYLDTGDLFYADVWDQGPPGEPGVNPRVLAQSALSRVPFTVPVPQMAPAIDGEQITGLPSWLWFDAASWVPVVAHAEAAGVSVTVTATPVRAEWDMGDGTVVECDGPGVPWAFDGSNPEHTDCSHVYQDTSADQPGGRYTGTVAIVWSIGWEASTGETGVLPDGRSSGPFSVLVTELQAVVTYDP